MKLQPWVEMENYEGLDHTGYLIAASRLFRCSKLERATFAYIREHMHDLGGVVDRYLPNVIDVTFHDDCLVYRYMVLVHKDCAKGIRMAEMFASRLDAKGYVDPESADIEDADDLEGFDYDKLPSEVPFNAAEPSGRYTAIKGFGGILTTFTSHRKSYARIREANKRAQLAEELGMSTIARRIGGASRRWDGVQDVHHDDHHVDSIEK